MSMKWLENIKKLKKERGMTNETLSQSSGISIGTLNKLLCGATADPKLSTLRPLALALGCSIDELLGEKTESSLPEKYQNQYNALDEEGRDAVHDTIEKEYDRIRKQSAMPYSLEAPPVYKIRLYDIPASAGTGVYLSGDDYKEISVYANSMTADADFAIRVYGDSMMPRYENGDILLVSRTETVEIGELGIFSVGGESFFKKFGGDRLISLNPAYKDIRLDEHADITCFGKVIGKLKK